MTTHAPTRLHSVPPRARLAVRTAFRCVVAAIMVVVPSGLVSAQLATFTPLGDLPGGGDDSQAEDVSADGTTVVGYSISDTSIGIGELFRWTAGAGMEGMGFIDVSFPESWAQAVNADGSVIVGVSKDQAGPPCPPDAHAVRIVDGTMHALGTLRCWSVARDVSDDGQVVVGDLDTEPIPGILFRKTFRWSADNPLSFAIIEPQAPYEHSFYGVTNGDGSVVVGWGVQGANTGGYRWTASTGTLDLGPGTACYEVSADGDVVVGSAGSNPARWTLAGEWQQLSPNHDLFGGEARDASADGSVIVGDAHGPGYEYGFRWSAANGMWNLNTLLTNYHGVDLTGWDLKTARGVSADGRVIVGRAINPNSDVEAYRVDLPPDPWAELGGALEGTPGVAFPSEPPELNAVGTLVAGQLVRLELLNARPSAQASLVIGLSALNAPLLGGTLVPDPLSIVPPFSTNNQGQLALTSPWPAGVPSGVDIYYQYWIDDPQGPAGYSASNGLRSTTP